MKPYEISPAALNDLFEIWQRIAEDSVDLANRIETEFYLLFDSLSKCLTKDIRERLDQPSRPVFPIHPFMVATSRT